MGVRMIYVGNFSYNDTNDDKDNYCLRPCLVEAQSTEEALELFSEHLFEVSKVSDLLDGAQEIYLDSIVELPEIPSNPLIMQWQKIMPAGDGLCSITSALPTVEFDDDVANAYSWNEAEHNHSHGHDNCEHDDSIYDHEDYEDREDHEDYGTLDDLNEELLEELAQDEEPFMRF